LLSFALIGLIISVGRESYRKYQLTKEINRLKSEIERLENKDQNLADLLEYFEDESYLEKEARLKLNLQKPGEKLVIISKDQQGQSGQTEQSCLDCSVEQGKGIPEETGLLGGKQQAETNFWKWWEYFFTP